MLFQELLLGLKQYEVDIQILAGPVPFGVWLYEDNPYYLDRSKTYS